MNKFNYIIAAYFGERRTSSSMKTTEFFLDTHLDFFNRTKNPQLNRIIVVLNIKNDDDDDKLQTIKDKYKHLPIKYIVKYNIGGSYYNFELGLLDSLFFDPDVDYSFVIEDDYMPFSPNFYLLPLAKKFLLQLIWKLFRAPTCSCLCNRHFGQNIC